MIIIDSISVTPNPVDAGKTLTVTINIREEEQDLKKYPNKYPYRYGKKREENDDEKTYF